MKVRCEGCGARIESATDRCPYCDAPPAGNTRKGRIGITHDFGYGSHSLQWLISLVILVFSTVAAFMDGRSFFTSTPAMGIWFGGLPLLSFLTALFRRRGLPSVLVFITFFLAAGGPFSLINLMRLSGHVDDSLGAGSLIGGISASAYLLGLAVHYRICYLRSRPRS